MVWSQLAELRKPPIAITDFLYLRFIGDRTIHEEDFGKIQKDRVMEMKKWEGKVRRVVKEEGRGRKNINLAIALANNHYAGFGPGTAIYSRIWWGCQRPHILKMRRIRRKKMTNRTYVAAIVTSISSTIIQSKVPFQIL